MPGDVALAAEETLASLVEAVPNAAGVYQRALALLGESGRSDQEAAGARRLSLEQARHLVELCRNLDLLERAAPGDPVVIHLARERRLVRALADSLLLLSSVALPEDAQMLPLLDPAELRRGVEAARDRGWFGPFSEPTPVTS